MPITTNFSTVWSVCLLSVTTHAPCLNNLVDLDAIGQVHLWGPFQWHTVLDGVPDHQGKSRFGRVKPCSQKNARRIERKQFRLLSNYFGACYYNMMVTKCSYQTSTDRECFRRWWCWVERESCSQRWRRHPASRQTWADLLHVSREYEPRELCTALW